MNPLTILGILLILAGFLLIWQEIIRQTTQIQQQLNTQDTVKSPVQMKGGGIVMLGPIPIILGTDRKYAALLALLAIILMLLALIYQSAANN